MHVKHLTEQCDNCFIGFEVPVVLCSVATTQESETNRLITVDCWHGGGSSRSKLVKSRMEQKGPYPYPLQFTKVYKTIYKPVCKAVYKVHHPPPTPCPPPPAWGG